MKRYVYPAILILLFIINKPALFAQEKMIVAVLDLQPKGASRIVAGAVTDIIRAEMVKTGLYIIVERVRMNEILKEHEFQMTGCTDQTCAVQIGKMLSARKILLGEINKIGQTFVISVRIVDVEKNISEFAATEKASSEDNLDQASRNITNSLSQNILEGNRDFFVEARKINYYMRSIVPGWGQIYAGNKIRGAIYMGMFVVAGTYWGLSHRNYQKKKNEYDNLPAGTDDETFNSKYKAYKDAGKRAYIALGIWGLTYVINWADALFLSKPDFSKVISCYPQKNIYISINSVNNGINPMRDTYYLGVTMRY